MRKLDGTKDFITGIPEFTVSVALVDKDQPILGVIYNPAVDALFYGVAASRMNGIFSHRPRITH